jgi:hypothetical protein
MKKLILSAALLGVGWAALHPSHAAPSKKVAAKKPANAIVVQGVVKTSTKPPRPGTVAYKDAVIALHLTGVKPLKGKVKREIVVFVWGMRNNKWVPAATYRPGKKVTLRLTRWEKAERKYGRYNRFELQDEATYDLDTYWGE